MYNDYKEALMEAKKEFRNDILMSLGFIAFLGLLWFGVYQYVNIVPMIALAIIGFGIAAMTGLVMTIINYPKHIEFLTELYLGEDQ